MAKDTTQLKALRDAAQEKDWPLLATCCEIALASLEAAEPPEPCAGVAANVPTCGHYDCDPTASDEQAQPCAGFVSRDWMTDEDEPTCARPYCGKPKGAHQIDDSSRGLSFSPCDERGQPNPTPPVGPDIFTKQPSAKQAQQPARRVAQTVRRKDAPAPATFHEADLDDLAKAQQSASDVPPMPHPFHPFPAHPLAVCEVTDVETLHAACVRIAAERDEARGELEAVKEDKRCALDLLTQERARADEAEAELAALKGQEPVGFMRRSLDGKELGEASEDYMENGLWGPSFPVYAAPVPAPDSIPREKHEAALAQARREERERCAVVADENGAIHTARTIRALAEKGEEVEKRAEQAEVKLAALWAERSLRIGRRGPQGKEN